MHTLVFYFVCTFTGCPLYLPEESVYEKLELLCDQEKDAVCSALFHCLNWFREVGVVFFDFNEKFKMAAKDALFIYDF